MGFAEYMAKEFMKELGNRSREFYEFVMPAIDMYEDGNELVVTVNLPGFAKKDIKLRITGNVLSISAKREPEANLSTVYYRQRPNYRDKKVPLPFSIRHDEQLIGTPNPVE